MVILVTLFVLYYAFAGIISIDLGTEYIKAASRKKKMNIVIEDLSGDKDIQNLIFFHKETKIYGNYAKEQLVDNPNLAYFGITQLLGLGKDSEIRNTYKENGFPYDFEHTERDTLKLKISSDAGYGDEAYITVEELSAMMLRYVYSLAVNHTGSINNKVVVCVPSSFTFTQRQALAESAKLANIQIDSIIDQTTAAAITYRMNYGEKESKRVVLIDVGSYHTQFCVFEINKSTPKTLKILGKDALSIGGSNFVMGVASLFVNYISKLGYSESLKKPDNVAEIRERSKEYLESLSTETEVTIENMMFMDDSAKNQKITREEFEIETNDLVKLIFETFVKLLADLNIVKVSFHSFAHHLELHI